jgi:hypothetical protein
MTTEVQIIKSYKYLPYLKRIFNRIASCLGIGASEMSIAEGLLGNACLGSDPDNCEEKDILTIRFDASDSYVTIEILDSSEHSDAAPVDSTAINASYPADADNVAWYSSGSGRIIRIRTPHPIISGAWVPNLQISYTR